MIRTVKKPSKQVRATQDLNRYLWVNERWIEACSNWYMRDSNDVFKTEARENYITLIIPPHTKAAINRNGGYKVEDFGYKQKAYINSLKAHIRYGEPYHYSYMRETVENA